MTWVQGIKWAWWGLEYETFTPSGSGFTPSTVADAVVRLYSGILECLPDNERFDYWLNQAAEAIGIPNDIDTLWS